MLQHLAMLVDGLLVYLPECDVTNALQDWALDHIEPISFAEPTMSLVPQTEYVRVGFENWEA